VPGPLRDCSACAAAGRALARSIGAMTDLAQALAAARRPTPARAPTAASAIGGPRRALVVGGGGALGSQVVERLLAGAAFAQVGVLVAQALQPALRGLWPVADDDKAWRRFAPDTALVVFDRARHANGRDDAFVAPAPAALPAWALRLRDAGVTTLVIVVPHAPGRLPQALKAGLASLDEGRVAALGFDRLVFMRSAQAADMGAAAMSAPERLARWMLGQLHWMVPQRDQPVRSATVARVAARLAAALPAAAPGTRVLPPELLWAAAQVPRAEVLVDDWLAGGMPAVPPLPAVPRQRW
jgi:hypothetical protein